MDVENQLQLTFQWKKVDIKFSLPSGPDTGARGGSDISGALIGAIVAGVLGVIIIVVIIIYLLKCRKGNAHQWSKLAFFLTGPLDMSEQTLAKFQK